jgi:hypothetical protein
MNSRFEKDMRFPNGIGDKLGNDDTLMIVPREGEVKENE